MKHKILLTSLLGLTIVCPAMAEPNIAADAINPGCTNSVLQTYTGPTQLEAEYTANTINLKWYGADGEITSVQNASKTCTYDGSITLPTTNPTRTGYTFAGWQVRGFDLSTLNASIGGSAYYGHGWNNNADYCYAYGDGTVDTHGAEVCLNESGMSDVGLQEWKTTFSYGTIYGEASCNNVDNAAATYINANLESVLAGTISGESFIYGLSQVATQEQTSAIANALSQYQSGAITYAEAEEIVMRIYRTNASYNKNSTGQYCWCKVTGYTPLNGNKQNVVASLWVFLEDLGSTASCASNCALYCGATARTHEALRVGLFGSVTQ